jgi:prepilin signal peptidase PulO-like enzyme (type II secretory pathway)
MEIFIYIMLFILGACLSSFLFASAYRIEKGYKYSDFVLLPSSCEKCNRKLSVIDLIPILGYLLTVGRCRSCGNKINVIYPLSELFLGISFVVLYYISAPVYIFFVLLSLVFLSYFDIESMSIPKNITDGLVFIFVIIYLVFVPISFQVITLLSVIVLFFIILNMVKKSFGFGDLIVVMYTSLYLSVTYILHYLFLIVFIGSIISIILVISRRITLKDYIPLIPIITVSFLVSVILSGLDINIFDGLVRLFAQLIVL